MPGAGVPKPRRSALARLAPAEAAAILTQLLKSHPELRAEAERLAGAMLDEVSAGDVAVEVEGDLRALDIDDLNDRAGPRHGGDTDPADAADELLEEALDPYVRDLRRRLATGRDGAAMETLRGILAGLYAARHPDGDEGGVLGWAPDFPRTAAAEVAGIWRQSGRDLPVEVLSEVAPDWAVGIARG